MLLKRVVKWLVALVIVIILVESLVAWRIWAFSSVDEAKPVDVAIVLGAAVWDEEASPVFQARIDHAIDLYEQGVVKGLLFTGGKAQGDAYAESEVARNYALVNGVLATHIFIETTSTITEENLQQAKRLMLDEQLETALIVSDPLHMKRAMLIAKDIGLDAYSSPTPYSQYKSQKSKAPFLAREVFYLSGYVVLRPFR